LGFYYIIPTTKQGFFLQNFKGGWTKNMIFKKGHEYTKKYPKNKLFVTSKNIKKQTMWIRLCSKLIVWTNTRHNCKGMGRGRTMFLYCFSRSEFKDIYLRLIVQGTFWLFFKIFIMDANRQWHNDGCIKKYWFKMMFMDEFHQIWLKNGCSSIFYSWMTNCNVWQIFNNIMC